MNFNVSEISFISRDYAQMFSKPLVYLHYIKNANKYPNATYQYVLKREPFTEKDTNESIIEEFKNYEKSVINVSSKCKLLCFIKDFQIEYPSIIDSINVFPNYNVEIVDLSNRNDSIPDLGIVWEINRIAPAMCGMLFENIIAECLKLKNKVYDISNVLCDHTSNIENKTIERLIERNFIKRDLVRCNNGVKINEKKIIMIEDEKLKKEHFVSRLHYLVFCSLCHFMKRDLNGLDVENALNILDYLKLHVEEVDEYICDMSNSTLIKSMNKDTGLKHGEIMRNDELSGEVDFISDQSIIDIKCYKDDRCLDYWFSQLWLYEQLFGPHKNLWIVNVYSNKVYKFSYER